MAYRAGARVASGGGSPHVLNAAVVSLLVGVPLFVYATRAAPTPDALTASLAAEHADTLARQAKSSAGIAAFWKHRAGSDMDAVYDDLLRAGRSRVVRHHALEGPLAAEEARAPTPAARPPHVTRALAAAAVAAGRADAEGGAGGARPAAAAGAPAAAAAAVAATGTSAPGAAAPRAAASAGPPLAAAAGTAAAAVAAGGTGRQ